MRVLIITGGTSSERKISLISANSVKKALINNGHYVTLFDFKKGFSELKRILKNYDIAFPVMHGKQGEDGTLYQFLKNQKILFVGSNPKGAKVAFDKILFKKYCDQNQIPTAKWRVIKTKEDIIKFGFPCVLKAANGGSSKEVALLNNRKDLNLSLVNRILKLDDQFYVEKLLRGIEITVGVLLDQPLPLIEIIPPQSGWFDYKNKYSGKSREIPFAPSVDEQIQKQAQEIALKLHKNLKLGSFSRTDIIVLNNIPFVLEINTPGGVGLTPESLFPKAAKAAGISFSQFVERVILAGI